MPTETRLPSAAHYDPTELFTTAQKETLQRAVAKMVALGQQLGVSVDQMILLLERGMSVCELLDYLAARKGEVA